MPILVRAGSIVPLDDEWTTVRGPCQLDADDDMATGPRPDGGGGGRGTVLGLDHAPRRLAFHCWPTDGGDARGRCVDDAGDGDGPVRRDALQMRGAVAGGSMVVTWERQGDFPAPASVRVVVHGLVADGAMADGEPVRVTGSSIECGPFSELRLQGARRAPGSTP
jgi:hypothetical protein